MVLSCIFLQTKARSKIFPSIDDSCALCGEVYKNQALPSRFDCDPVKREKVFISLNFTTKEIRGACVGLDIDDLERFEKEIPSNLNSVSIFMDRSFEKLEIRIVKEFINKI